MSEIELAGLDGTNPLAYLAALGVLRTLNEAAVMHGPDAPTLRWTSPDWRPVVAYPGIPSAEALVDLLAGKLSRSAGTAPAAVAEAKRAYDDARTRLKQKRDEIKQRRLQGAERVTALDTEVRPLEETMERLRRDWRARLLESAPDPAVSLDANLTASDSEFRDFVSEAARAATTATRRWTDFCAAFGCEYGTDDPATRMHATPLAMVNGSGHQDFLGSVAELMRRCTADHLRTTLLQTWPQPYPDSGYSLRLDPFEDRRYALMAQDPTAAGNKPRTVWGANRLAFEALPLFPCAATMPAPTVLCVVDDRRGTFFYWPLWQLPLTLDAVRSLLTLPDLANESVQSTHALRRRGVRAVYRAERLRVGSKAGRYFNFTPAAPVWC
jgi:hypothetical protein